MKKSVILSIDGGGIRGILPGVILAYMEKEIQQREGENARLCDYFDLMAGTSTGGILTCLYLVPGNNGRPKYSAAEAVELYLNYGQKIFQQPWYKRLTNPWGIARAKYSADSLESLLNEYLEEALLSDALKPCLITGYDFFQRRSVFFNQKDTLKGDVYNYYLKDIARSTSAAPTYFKPSRIYSLFKAPKFLIDGGVFANNPAMCAYAEARTSAFSRLLKRTDKPDFPEVENMLLISIGTGSHGEPYSFNKAVKWGVAGWLQPLIDILMAGNSETVNYQLRQLFNTAKSNNQGGYYRIEPTVGAAGSKLDLVTEPNIKALEEAARSYISENKQKLDHIIDLLIINK